MVTLAKEYLANNIEWKAWDHDMQTAEALWRLQDLSEYIVLELSQSLDSMDQKLSSIYFSPKGYWRCIAAVKK